MNFYLKFEPIGRGISEALSQVKHNDAIESVWFSDSFLFYTIESDPSDFWMLEVAARSFFDTLIYAEIPLTGTISYGEFYADRDNSAFLGSALTDAVRQTESQNWIGFVLHGSTVEALRSAGIDLDEMLHYANVEIPLRAKNGPIPGTKETMLPAYTFGLDGTIRGQESAITALERMRNAVESDTSVADELRKRIAEKYNRTIRHIESNRRYVRPRSDS